MKHLISAALAAMMLASPAYAAVSQRNIHDGWQFRQGRSEIWYPATVPGTVHTDVYLNGSLLLNADNMHRTWRVDVKDKIKPGENKLEVYLHSPIKIDLPKCDQYDYGFNTGPDQSQNGGKQIAAKTVALKKGMNRIEMPATVKNPRLWWPNGLGEAYLYNLIREYMNDEFVTPDNFEDFLYVGMILQGDAIKTAMEAHRRDMPYCMGTLVWQHNDCWPVASWAGRDYYGRWKAQQYFARNAYRDILVSPVVKGDTLSVNLVSDRRSDARGKFHLRAITLNGTTVWEKRMNTTAEALTSKKIFESDLKAMIGDRKKGDLIFTVTFETPGSEPYTNIAYAVRQKFMNYPAPDFNVEIARAPEADGYDVTIGSDVFARGVFLSLEGIDNFFSDNYFDILPGTSRKIHVKTGLNADNFKKQLKINSIGNTLTSKKI